MAGHAVMKVFAGFAAVARHLAVAVVITAIYGLEVLVARPGLRLHHPDVSST
jgi:hypothetical protein